MARYCRTQGQVLSDTHWCETCPQPADLRQWIESEIARLAASDVGARQDRAKVLERLLKDYDAQVRG